jgi:hypothetical protein
MNSRRLAKANFERLEALLNGARHSASIPASQRNFVVRSSISALGWGDMLKSFLVFLVAALSCGAAWAQQNSDIYVTYGNPGSRAHPIDGTNITVAGSPAFTTVFGFGYQVARVSSTSLWLDLSEINGFPNNVQASVPGGGKNNWTAGTAGVRLMAPVYKRLSLYAVSGAGGGVFRALAAHVGSGLSVSTYDTVHGVFAFGGGADLRLLRWFSLRAEVRDLVTGEQLGGAAGRQHVLPTFGIAFHL